MKLLAALSLLLFPIATAEAVIQTRAIEYKAGDTTLVGFLAWDDTITSKAPAPGVLVCPEWWGNNEYAHSRAKQLAELGYVALAIDMYGKGDDGKAKTTSDPKVAGEWAGGVYKDPKVLAERVTAGYNALTSQTIVDAKNTAAIGYCMGGTIALSLARTGADLKAVVAFHASNISASGDDAAAFAANEKMKATVLICHGQDDTFVKPGELDTFHAQMKVAKVDYVLSSYSGAVHAFTNPKADDYKVPGVAYNKNADRRSWDAMVALFIEKFGPTPKRVAEVDLQQVREKIDRVSEEIKDLKAHDEAMALKLAAAGIPQPLTAEAIAKLDKQSAMREMVARRTYPQKVPSLDTATKRRMEQEVHDLMEHLKQLNAAGGK